jgi:hypothetical protein
MPAIGPVANLEPINPLEASALLADPNVIGFSEPSFKY